MDRYIVKKYIMARSAKHAIAIEKDVAVTDVWVDEEWRKMNDEVIKKNKTGF